MNTELETGETKVNIAVDSGFKVLVSALLAVLLTMGVVRNLDLAAATSLNGVGYSQLMQSP